MTSRTWNQGLSKRVQSRGFLYSLILILVFATEGSPFARGVSAKRAERIRKAENLAKVSAAFFQRSLRAEDGIPTNILSQAKAVAVFPVVSSNKGFWGGNIKAEGVISRRVGPVTWTAPAFFEITKSSGSGIKGSTSMVVLVFKEDNAVDRLRMSKFGSLQELNVNSGPVKENGRDPTLVTVDGEPLYADSDAFYYEYVDGVSVSPNSVGASIRSKDSYNDAIYELNSKDVLFYQKDKALKTANEPARRGVQSFTAAVNALPPNPDITPKINEFFDAGYDYAIDKSLQTIKEHMKSYLNDQGFAYREEATDDGVIITTFRDLESRGRRFRRTAFMIKIIRTKQEYYCNVQFRWHVSSRGEDEGRYRTLDEDKNITDQDVLLKSYIQQIEVELQKLKDDK